MSVTQRQKADPVIAGTSSASPAPPRSDVLFEDRFTRDRRPGRVLGTAADGPGGVLRAGADAERVLSIDHGALRIQPLVRPGWGRSGVAYGPVRREPGLVLAVFMVNGHNLSQTYRMPSVWRHFKRWIRGADAAPLHRRGVDWLLWHRPREKLLRKLRGWWLSREGGPAAWDIRENLAVGFFPEEAPADPLAGSQALIVRAADDYNNGELWTVSRDPSRGDRARGASAFVSMQNVPTYFVVVLRERGAAYYVASYDGAHGFAGYPRMRPVGIDAGGDAPELWAGVHQSVLGEVGFTIDSRVYAVKAARVPELAAWFGGAHAADALEDVGPAGFTRREAEAGGAWEAVEWVGAENGEREARLNLLIPPRPSGLLHAIVDGAAELAWRVRDGGNWWAFQIGPSGCALRICEGGRVCVIAESADVRAGDDRARAVQILDDGREITICVDGELVFGTRFTDARLADDMAVGVVGDGSGVRRFEAHPREAEIPEALDLGAPWSDEGDAARVEDRFAEGPAGADLAGRTTELGAKTWERVLGRGAVELTAAGDARVRASVATPNPGRTIYAVDWDEPGFADLELEMTPPGTARGQRESGRTGLVFWQDSRNYILVNLWLDDSLLTTSISSFFCLRGFEDIYDAVWTCLGAERATWGERMTLRIVFDGMRYMVRVNGEPVLSRALTDVYPSQRPLKIRKVGVAATWEYGDDTGTVIHRFAGRGRGRVEGERGGSA